MSTCRKHTDEESEVTNKWIPLMNRFTDQMHSRTGRILNELSVGPWTCSSQGVLHIVLPGHKPLVRSYTRTPGSTIRPAKQVNESEMWPHSVATLGGQISKLAKNERYYGWVPLCR